MPEKFAYLEDGTKVSVIAVTAKGMLVSTVYCPEGDDEEEYVGREAYLVDRVFDMPMTAKLDEKITRLEAKIAEKRDELNAIDNAIKTAKEQSAELMKIYPTLEYIRMYFSGELKWCVTASHYFGDIELLPTEEAIKQRRNNGNWDDEKLRLVSLWGRTNGHLEWDINRYSDGSGSSSQIFLFKTREEAFSKAIELADVRFVRFRNQGGNGTMETEDLITLGIPIPRDIQEHNHKITLESATRRAEEKRKEYQDAEACLKRLQSETA